MSHGKQKNFLSQFRDQGTKKLKNFTATQFAEVWSHYDQDGNGFIEGAELDEFLHEFISSVVSEDAGNEVVSETAMAQMKRDFMEAFDENLDGKIEIGELSQILPTEENFLLLFRRNNPVDSSVEFMRIWKQFDKDNSGFIEADELKDFLKSILDSADKPLQLFDQNRDGKLQLSEMARKISSSDIDRVFSLYDRDKNGTIENEELQGFLKDLLELAQEDYDDQDMQFFKRVILDQWDVNHDGKISKDELKMILMQQSRIASQMG
uniref:Calbindin-32 n=1 Tax=Macrostomum lignano TaxID=282301 RepID=A0A1I8GC46_9PLAT